MNACFYIWGRTLLHVTVLVFLFNHALFAQNIDSTQTKFITPTRLWYPNYIKYNNILLKDIKASNRKPKKTVPGIQLFNYIDIQRRPWTLDYRESSYYVPRVVNDRLARIMDRPSPDSFVSVWALAYLAARLAAQYIDIQKKIEITAKDYLQNSESFPILIALWKKSPQTARELYEMPQLASSFTLHSLIRKLDELSENKLVKKKTRINLPPLYFPAQTSALAKITIEQGLTDIPLNMAERSRLKKLLQMINQQF